LSHRWGRCRNGQCSYHVTRISTGIWLKPR
jgi:hypothetical protein